MTKIERIHSEEYSWVKNSEHELRSSLLGELHARPFDPITVPRTFFHYAFLVDEQEKKQGRIELQSLVRSRGGALPAPEDKFWRSNLSNWDLRWEEHTEFTSYRWGRPLQPHAVFSSTPEFAIEPAGKLLVAVQLSIIKEDDFNMKLEDLFNPNSLCVIEAFGGSAQIITDFQLDPTGHIRILILDKNLSNMRAGVLIQRVLEIETYRTLALLGLPIARNEAPNVKRMEDEIAIITRNISQNNDMESNHTLLNKLTALTAELEAQTAETGFRFGACRAYYNIVLSRLKAIDEAQIPGRLNFTSFFERGLTPAIATCDAIEKRQSDLSSKLVRTIELLTTRIQFELEHQNRDLLKSMDANSKVQIRLQQTVEGLSIIAVSYAAVGLAAYIFKATNLAQTFLSTELMTAFAVPVVLFIVWLGTRSIHRGKKND